MSSKTSKSRSHENFDINESDLSEIIISFEELLNRIKAIDVYSGNENIPFRERDEEFQKLLLSEFRV